MNPKTKIKVNRLQLIEAIREDQTKSKANYDRRKAEREADLLEYPAKVAEWLRKKADKIQKTKGNKINLSCYRFFDDAPVAPHVVGTPNTDHGLALKQLGMSTEDTISISVEDFARYLG